jgi:hypothetical protein
MSTRGIAPDCRRVHFDVPTELYALIRAEAEEPPSVSVAEWCRRLAAWRVGFTLPTAADRKEQRVRLTGEPKKRTGPKPKYSPEQVNDSRETESASCPM